MAKVMEFPNRKLERLEKLNSLFFASLEQAQSQGFANGDIANVALAYAISIAKAEIGPREVARHLYALSLGLAAEAERDERGAKQN